MRGVVVEDALSEFSIDTQPDAKAKPQTSVSNSALLRPTFESRNFANLDQIEVAKAPTSTLPRRLAIMAYDIDGTQPRRVSDHPGNNGVAYRHMRATRVLSQVEALEGFL